MTYARALFLAATLALLPAACQQAQDAVVKAGVNQTSLDDIIAEEPDLAPVFEADPELAQDYLDTLKRAVNASGGALTPEIYDQARAVLSKAMITRVVSVEPALQRRFLGLTRDTFVAFRANDPRICQSMFLGRPLGDIQQAMPEPLVRKEREIMAEILSAPTTDNGREVEADAARGTAFVQQATLQILEAREIDTSNPDAFADMAPETACDLIIDVTKARLAASDQVVADTLAADRDAAL